MGVTCCGSSRRSISAGSTVSVMRDPATGTTQFTLMLCLSYINIMYIKSFAIFRLDTGKLTPSNAKVFVKPRTAIFAEL